MKLEQQCCSLELAKRLKELGVKQESHFWRNEHYVCSNGCHTKAWRVRDKEGCNDVLGIFSAFTVAELAEMIPAKIPDHIFGEVGFIVEKDPIGDCAWDVGYVNDNYEQQAELSATDVVLPNALAKMLIYLIENKLVTV